MTDRKASADGSVKGVCSMMRFLNNKKISVLVSHKPVTLSALTIGSLTLDSTFGSDTVTYTTTTSNTVSATVTDSGATIEIKNGFTVVTNGSAATWKTGENTVTVKVSNGITSKTYTVTVTKSLSLHLLLGWRSVEITQRRSSFR